MSIVNDKKSQLWTTQEKHGMILWMTLYEWHYEWQKITIVNDTGVAWYDFMNTIMNNKLVMF